MTSAKRRQERAEAHEIPVRLSHLLQHCSVGAIVRDSDKLMVVPDISRWDQPGEGHERVGCCAMWTKCAKYLASAKSCERRRSRERSMANGQAGFQCSASRCGLAAYSAAFYIVPRGGNNPTSSFAAKQIAVAIWSRCLGCWSTSAATWRTCLGMPLLMRTERALADAIASGKTTKPTCASNWRRSGA